MGNRVKSGRRSHTEAVGLFSSGQGKSRGKPVQSQGVMSSPTSVVSSKQIRHMYGSLAGASSSRDVERRGFRSVAGGLPLFSPELAGANPRFVTVLLLPSPRDAVAVAAAAIAIGLGRSEPPRAK